MLPSWLIIRHYRSLKDVIEPYFVSSNPGGPPPFVARAVNLESLVQVARDIGLNRAQNGSETISGDTCGVIAQLATSSKTNSVKQAVDMQAHALESPPVNCRRRLALKLFRTRTLGQRRLLRAYFR